MPDRLPHPLPTDLAESVADRFRLLADPTRLRLLDLLREGERSVSDLVVELECSQANVSKQLGLLADAGILERRRAGVRCYYRVIDPQVYQLCEVVCESLRRHWRARAHVLEPS